MLLSQPALGKLIGIDGHAQGNEPIANAVQRIKTVERLVKQKIVVTEFRGEWRMDLREDETAVQ